MDETEVFKKALKIAFIKEILPQQLENEGILKKEDFHLNEKGEITLPKSQQRLEIFYNLVKYLTSELASVKADLWIKQQSNKKG
ncbi:MAG: hypothetical protein ACPLKS_07485 [Caldisericum exile]|uniref:hypothetical protein n=1 Tax=Caldisericum exile TaxID=693075 RepID=UPI003C71D5B7